MQRDAFVDAEAGDLTQGITEHTPFTLIDSKRSPISSNQQSCSDFFDVRDLRSDHSVEKFSSRMRLKASVIRLICKFSGCMSGLVDQQQTELGSLSDNGLCNQLVLLGDIVFEQILQLRSKVSILEEKLKHMQRQGGKYSTEQDPQALTNSSTDMDSSICIPPHARNGLSKSAQSLIQEMKPPHQKFSQKSNTWSVSIDNELNQSRSQKDANTPNSLSNTQILSSIDAQDFFSKDETSHKRNSIASFEQGGSFQMAISVDRMKPAQHSETMSSKSTSTIHIEGRHTNASLHSPISRNASLLNHTSIREPNSRNMRAQTTKMEQDAEDTSSELRTLSMTKRIKEACNIIYEFTVRLQTFDTMGSLQTPKVEKNPFITSAHFSSAHISSPETIAVDSIWFTNLLHQVEELGRISNMSSHQSLEYSVQRAEFQTASALEASIPSVLDPAVPFTRTIFNTNPMDAQRGLLDIQAEDMLRSKTFMQAPVDLRETGKHDVDVRDKCQTSEHSSASPKSLATSPFARNIHGPVVTTGVVHKGRSSDFPTNHLGNLQDLEVAFDNKESLQYSFAKVVEDSRKDINVNRKFEGEANRPINQTSVQNFSAYLESVKEIVIQIITNISNPPFSLAVSASSDRRSFRTHPTVMGKEADLSFQMQQVGLMEQISSLLKHLLGLVRRISAVHEFQEAIERVRKSAESSSSWGLHHLKGMIQMKEESQ
eukprot:TRINITY_DN11078_c0_g1_i1.p1 TRINITY_DN11078_c0_g1~~TRINITY_DN11078_c0_g1_i1.p1  ORF type:complete len:713 (+),score=120.50 TRINITY_DN11078_c0_g1_i1:51-2189(+)